VGGLRHCHAAIAYANGVRRAAGLNTPHFALLEVNVARKYSAASGKKVEKTMKEMKAGTLRSGGSGKKVTSRKQAIAIGLSEARREGKKVPKKTAA